MSQTKREVRDRVQTLKPEIEAYKTRTLTQGGYLRIFAEFDNCQGEIGQLRLRSAESWLMSPKLEVRSAAFWVASGQISATFDPRRCVSIKFGRISATFGLAPVMCQLVSSQFWLISTTFVQCATGFGELEFGVARQWACRGQCRACFGQFGARVD